MPVKLLKDHYLGLKATGIPVRPGATPPRWHGGVAPRNMPPPQTAPPLFRPPVLQPPQLPSPVVLGAGAPACAGQHSALQVPQWPGDFGGPGAYWGCRAGSVAGGDDCLRCNACVARGGWPGNPYDAAYSPCAQCLAPPMAPHGLMSAEPPLYGTDISTCATSTSGCCGRHGAAAAPTTAGGSTESSLSAWGGLAGFGSGGMVGLAPGAYHGASAGGSCPSSQPSDAAGGFQQVPFQQLSFGWHRPSGPADLSTESSLGSTAAPLGDRSLGPPSAARRGSATRSSLSQSESLLAAAAAAIGPAGWAATVPPSPNLGPNSPRHREVPDSSLQRTAQQPLQQLQRAEARSPPRCHPSPPPDHYGSGPRCSSSSMPAVPEWLAETVPALSAASGGAGGRHHTVGLAGFAEQRRFSSQQRPRSQSEARSEATVAPRSRPCLAEASGLFPRLGSLLSVAASDWDAYSSAELGGPSENAGGASPPASVADVATLDTGPLCSVCLTNIHGDAILGVRKLPCGHEFHRACVDKWLRFRSTCPLCCREVSGCSGVRKDASAL